MMSLEVILFDLDETLVVEHAVIEEAFLVTCEHANQKYGCDPKELTDAVRKNARRLWYDAPTIEYCLRVGISSWEGLWARFLGDDPNLSYLRNWAPEYRRQSWFNALLEFGIDDNNFAKLLSDSFMSERRKRHFLFPEVQDSLQDLRFKYRLGLVTNGPSDLQAEKIRRTDIGKFFDNIFISGEIGIGKPDIRVFNLALRKFSVAPTRVLMVGDSLERDIQGAQNAGIRSALINRREFPTDANGIVPDIQIKSLNELVEVMMT